LKEKRITLLINGERLKNNTKRSSYKQFKASGKMLKNRQKE
jgi:hypothetical protein